MVMITDITAQQAGESAEVLTRLMGGFPADLIMNEVVHLDDDDWLVLYRLREALRDTEQRLSCPRTSSSAQPNRV